MRKRWMLGGVAAVATATVAAATAMPQAAGADPDDFVVQQVCIDAADRAVAGDPAHCPHRRKLHIGESIPYRRVDAGNWQALYSYPVEGLAGERRAVAEKIFGGSDPSGSFSDLGQRSGFDLIEVGRDFVSAIRTSDPGGGDQIFWRTAACDRADGWIFFPPGLARGQHGEISSTLKITPGPSTACPFLWAIAPDHTVWNHPVEPVHYTSGKRLDTITSQHFAFGDPENPAHDNDSMEMFYFTREYGFSRWEAWETPAGCSKRAQRSGRDAATMCRPSPLTLCNGADTATYFGKLYLRLDCRDSTFYVADPGRPFNPLVNDAAPGDILNRNLLANGTFVTGRTGWGSSDAMRVQAIEDPRTHDRALQLACGPCGGATLSQSFIVPANERARSLHWGMMLGPTSDRPSVQARIVLTLTPEGQPARSIERTVQAKGSAQSFAFDLPWDDLAPRSVAARLEIRFDDPTTAVIDDTFATLLGRDAQ